MKHLELLKCKGNDCFSIFFYITFLFYRGNLIVAIDLFNKAIELARTELEMTHLFSLRDAAASQLRVTTRLHIGPQLLVNDA